MEEWRSYTTLSNQERRKDMGPPSDPLRFVSSPRGNELTHKAVEMINISTLQRKELERMRNTVNHSGENEEDWLNSLESWKSKRNWTLERRKDSAREHIKSSLSDSIDKGRESGLGSSVFSPVEESICSPSSYVLTNYSTAPQPTKGTEKSELDQVLIQLQLLREKKEKGEQEDVPSRFTPPLSHIVGKTTSTHVHMDMDRKEASSVSATLHYAPTETEKKRVESPRTESKRLEKDAIVHDKMRKPTRMVVDIGLDDSPALSSHLRSSYRSSCLNPITPPIPQSTWTLYPSSGESAFSGTMRMYGSLPRKRDTDYRVISVDEKIGPGRLSDFVSHTDRQPESDNGTTRGSRKEDQPLLIRNYHVLPITGMDTPPKWRTIEEFDHRPIKTVDNYSTLPSKWSNPVPTPSHRIGRSAQRVERKEMREREVHLTDGTTHIEIDERVSTEILTPLVSTGTMVVEENWGVEDSTLQEWLSVTQGQKFATPGVKKSGGNLVRKEFVSELQEKIVKKMENEEKRGKESKRLSLKNTLSAKELCAECGDRLGNGSAMVIGTIGLSFHLRCFRCSHCGMSLATHDSEGAKVQLEGGRLHCLSCFQNSPLSSYHTLVQ